MIAWLLRAMWCAVIALGGVASWWSVHLFAAKFGTWFSILLAIMVVAALHPVAIALCFALSRLFGDPVPAAYRLSPWRMITTFDAEVDASMRGVWFGTPFLARRAAPRPAPNAPRRDLALLFVHGYFCNRAVWHSFMKDAAARGYRCEAVTLDEGFASIDGHAAVVDHAIDQLLENGADRVAIIAHSMGGLVARACLQKIDATRVVHVFTLGSPHRGTHAARYGLATSVGQMRRDSRWLAQLALREEETGRGLPRSAYTAVFSHHDDVVYPQTTGALEGAACVAIGGCGHVSLLYDRRVRAIVFDRIAALESNPGHATPAQAGSS